MLQNLYDPQRLIRVVLLYTPSNSLSLFVQDAIKKRYNVSSDAIVRVNSKKDLSQTSETNNIVPFFSDRWFYHVESGDKLIKKDFLKLVQSNTSGIYFVEFTNYRSYMFAKDMLKREQGVLDLYLAYLRRADFHTLYTRIVVANEGTQLSKALYDFVSRGYAGEIESVFNLFNALKDKQDIKGRNDIIEICGLSSNTIDSFMFSLLKEPTLSDKGLKKYISNRLKEAVELADKYTWVKFRNFLRVSVKSSIDIKMILSSGEVYDNITNYENEAYNTKRLKRFQRHLPKIKETSVIRFVGLLSHLEKSPWRSEIDFLNFFYNFIEYKYKSNPAVQDEMRKALLTKQSERDRKASISARLNEGVTNRSKQSNNSTNSSREAVVAGVNEQFLETRNIFNSRLEQFRDGV